MRRGCSRKAADAIAQRVDLLEGLAATGLMAALAASKRVRPEEMAILIVATGGQRSGEKWEAKASFRIAEMSESERSGL
jgi:hypothetical protein